MHFNKAELRSLACHPSHDFNKEGVLLFLERQESFFRKSEAYVERWCRLRGNLLFYFKTKDYCSDPAGALVLEDFQIVEEESQNLHSFTLVFHDSSHTLCAENEEDKVVWIDLIQRASFSYMKAQIDNLLHHIRICHSNHPISLQKHRMDTGTCIDLSKPPFLEMSISCDNLRCDSNGNPPNARVSVYILKPPHQTWILYFQTEVVQAKSNPIFLSTVAFRHCDGIDGDTKLCFIVCNIQEKVSNTFLPLGKTMSSMQTVLESGRMRLFLLSPHKDTVGFLNLNIWLVNSDSNETKLKYCHATPKHYPNTGSPKPMSHRRTQSLPPKLTSQLKQPSHGNLCLVYENPTVSTFKFHSGLGGDISVMEIMAEPFLTFQFPLQLLRLWISEEQLCHEEITSLGDLTEEWRGRQMALLNQHSTLINVYGIALSTMEANISAGIFFKKSIEKEENSLEFAPTNLHLQRFFAQNDSLRRSKSYDCITVGAFTANSLKYKKGGLLDMFQHLKTLQSKSGPREEKATQCEDAIDNLRRLRKEIILLLRLLILSLQKKELRSLASTLNQLKDKTNLLLNILDPCLVDEAFEFLDQIRVPQNPSHPFTIASRECPFSEPIKGYLSPERALEMELASPVIQDVFEDSDHGQKLLEELSSHKCNSYKAKLEEGLSEFCINSCYKSTDEPEPWDLIHLNIRASLICLSSKIKSFSQKLGGSETDVEGKKDGTTSSLSVAESLLETPVTNPASGKEEEIESEHSLSQGNGVSPDVSPCDDSGIVVDRAHGDGEKFESIDTISPLPSYSGSTAQTTFNSSQNCISKSEGKEFLESSLNPLETLKSSEKITLTDSPLMKPQEQGDWLSEVRPSIKKLRQAIDGLMRTARLTHSVFRLKENPESSQFSHSIKYRRDICFSQALTSVVTALMTKIWCKKVDSNFASILTKLGPLVVFEGLLSCYKAEAGRISDFYIAIEDVGMVDFIVVPSGVFSQIPKGHTQASQQKIPLPRVTGTRKALRVILPVPEQMLSLLPCSAKGHPSDPPAFRITPVFFNVGINEEATLAAKLCKDGSQYRNNQHNYEKLLSYYNRFKCLFPPEQDSRRSTLSSPSGSRKRESLSSLFTQLHTEVFLQQPKNVAILQIAAKICRLMEGLRFTSCKSGKDRTAMSVTLEEVTILKDDFDLAPSEFELALNCLRSEGTRLRNCEKNLGRAKFAFSSVQLALFPRHYKPPPGTFGVLPT